MTEQEYERQEQLKKFIDEIFALGLDSNLKDNHGFILLLEDLFKKEESLRRFIKGETYNWSKKENIIELNTNKDDKDEKIVVDVGKNGITITNFKKEKGNYQEKSVDESIITVNQDNGIITLREHHITITPNENKCNEYMHAKMYEYSKEGVMLTRQEKHFTPQKRDENYLEYNGYNSLYFPRQTTTYDRFSSYPNQPAPWDRLFIMQRDSLDTARVISEDNNKGTRYKGKVELNQEIGLRDLRVNVGYDKEHTIINPLTEEEIAILIHNEEHQSDSIVAEGLKKYIDNRTTTSYDSEKDSDFVRVGYPNSQNKTR